MWALYGDAFSYLAACVRRAMLLRAYRWKVQGLDLSVGFTDSYIAANAPGRVDKHRVTRNRLLVLTAVLLLLAVQVRWSVVIMRSCAEPGEPLFADRRRSSSGRFTWSSHHVVVNGMRASLRFLP